MAKKPQSKRTVETLTHEKARRKNIPTAEYQSILQKEEQSPVRIAAPHWTTPLPEEKFPGKGYVPQAMTHGTLNGDDKEVNDKFLANVLGLDIIGGGRTSTYISVPNMGPWYVVVLPTVHRDYLSEANRFTLKLASPEEVEDAHKDFSKNGKQLGLQDLRELETNGRAQFLLSDISKNWWEITS